MHKQIKKNNNIKTAFYYSESNLKKTIIFYSFVFTVWFILIEFIQSFCHPQYKGKITGACLWKREEKRARGEKTID